MSYIPAALHHPVDLLRRTLPLQARGGPRTFQRVTPGYPMDAYVRANTYSVRDWFPVLFWARMRMSVDPRTAVSIITLGVWKPYQYNSMIQYKREIGWESGWVKSPSPGWYATRTSYRPRAVHRGSIIMKQSEGKSYKETRQKTNLYPSLFIVYLFSNSERDQALETPSDKKGTATGSR